MHLLLSTSGYAKYRNTKLAEPRNKNDAEKKLEAVLTSPRVSVEASAPSTNKPILGDYTLGKLRGPVDDFQRKANDFIAANPSVKDFSFRSPALYGITVGKRF